MGNKTAQTNNFPSMLSVLIHRIVVAHWHVWHCYRCFYLRVTSKCYSINFIFLARKIKQRENYKYVEHRNKDDISLNADYSSQKEMIKFSSTLGY